MAVLRKITLECDDCHEVFEDFVGYTVAEVRALARDKGWASRMRRGWLGNKTRIDLCYGCRF